MFMRPLWRQPVRSMAEARNEFIGAENESEERLLEQKRGIEAMRDDQSAPAHPSTMRDPANGLGETRTTSPDAVGRRDR